MDDLVIEGKTYLSSKRAAEVTGYAKDYVGQLCREGRVEARLVGRSWYVLEQSIREHRFGTPEKEVETQVVQAPIEERVAEEEASPWNSPKYISEDVAPLPELRPKIFIDKSLNLLARTDASDITRFEALKIEEEESRLSEEVLVEKMEVDGAKEEDQEVNIAIHKVPEVEREPTAFVAPLSREKEVKKPLQDRRQQKKRGSNLVHTSILIGIAIISIAVILIGTGYIDSAPFEGQEESIIDFLGGKSFYSK